MQKILFCWSLSFLLIVGLEGQNNQAFEEQSAKTVELEGKIHYTDHATNPSNQGTLLPTFTVSKIIEASGNVLIKQEDKVIFKGGKNGYIRVKKGTGTNSKGVVAQKGTYFRAYIASADKPSLALETIEELPPIANTNKSTLKVTKIKVYPNPFKDRFTIELELIQSALVTIELFDPLGRRLRVPLMKNKLIKGDNQVEIVGTHLLEGIYLCKIRVGQEEFVQSILKIR